MRAAGALYAALVVACGCGASNSGSGVPGGKRLAEMSPAEVQDLCEFMEGQLGPERVIACPDGSTASQGVNASECFVVMMRDQVNFPNCALTVSQYEACIEVVRVQSDAQRCESGTPFPACSPLFEPGCV